MKKHPIIIVAPHAFLKIPQKFRSRIQLSDHEIWQMSDPFTEETCQYPKALDILTAKSHRILGDLNRDRKREDIFRETDFYGRKIWKQEYELNHKEKEELLIRFWDPFRRQIKKSFQRAKKAGFKKILFIDHHNTAIDHPANHGQYLPPVNLGNFGDLQGNPTDKKLSSSPEVINLLRKTLQENLPELTVEMNKVYTGSSLIKYIRDEIIPSFPELEIHSIHLEYNLNLIFNPLSKKIDSIAKNKLKKGFNRALEKLVETYFLE